VKHLQTTVTTFFNRYTTPVMLVLVLASSPCMAQTYVTGWDANGVPQELSDPVTVDPALLQAITLALPECQDVRVTHPEFISTDEQVRVSLSDSADIYVTFIHEGAGFRNSFGCFLYDTNNPPTDTSNVTKEVLFPNTSYLNSGGGLNTGDTVFAGRHGPGTTMGFWLSANTWRQNSGTYVESGWCHWSVRDLNAETDEALRSHMVLLSDDGENLILGFEDILRSEPSCDQDFNDVVFMVQANPPEALILTEVTELPGPIDSDGDGITDIYDSFPDDPHRASVQYTPSVSDHELIAFEDKWPHVGDYDFNDLVVKYQFQEMLDASGDIKEFRAQLEPMARGALMHNGFALQLEVPTSSIDSVRLFIDEQETDTSNVLEPGTGDRLVLVAFTDAHDFLPAPVGSEFANTEPGYPQVTASPIELRVVFVDPVPRSTLGLPPYNPFLFRSNSRGHEVHLLDHQPSDHVS